MILLVSGRRSIFWSRVAGSAVDLRRLSAAAPDVSFKIEATIFFGGRLGQSRLFLKLRTRELVDKSSLNDLRRCQSVRRRQAA